MRAEPLLVLPRARAACVCACPLCEHVCVPGGLHCGSCSAPALLHSDGCVQTGGDSPGPSRTAPQPPWALLPAARSAWPRTCGQTGGHGCQRDWGRVVGAQSGPGRSSSGGSTGLNHETGDLRQGLCSVRAALLAGGRLPGLHLAHTPWGLLLCPGWQHAGSEAWRRPLAGRLLGPGLRGGLGPARLPTAQRGLGRKGSPRDAEGRARAPGDGGPPSGGPQGARAIWRSKERAVVHAPLCLQASTWQPPRPHRQTPSSFCVAPTQPCTRCTSAMEPRGARCSSQGECPAQAARRSWGKAQAAPSPGKRPRPPHKHTGCLSQDPLPRRELLQAPALPGSRVRLPGACGQLSPASCWLERLLTGRVVSPRPPPHTQALTSAHPPDPGLMPACPWPPVPALTVLSEQVAAWAGAHLEPTDAEAARCPGRPRGPVCDLAAHASPGAPAAQVGRGGADPGVEVSHGRPGAPATGQPWHHGAVLGRPLWRAYQGAPVGWGCGSL